MFIVMVSPECASAAKVGGMADVVQGLAYELSIRGNDVEVVLPKYDCLRYDRIWGLTRSFDDLWVPYGGGRIHCSVDFGFVDGVKCHFIDPHSEQNYFNRGHFYGSDDDIDRFAFFSRAALEFMLQSGKHPDVIHCHDWQTGLVPVLLWEIYAGCGMTHPRVCYTLHNLGHQGATGDLTLHQVGLDPARCATEERLLHNGAINLMKGGIVYSNFVTTVSPRYAEEIRHTDQGMGLQGVLHEHGGKIGGVLNGVDYNAWNPEIDPHIPGAYGVDSLDAKYANKDALRDRLLLRKTYSPIVSVISRLDHQKGVDLIRHGLFQVLSHEAQFVLLGSSPQPAINDDFVRLKGDLNDNPDCHLEIGFDEELAHLIYAGSDMILIPSVYEPCGLTQMIAMKDGTVPVVRATGGLADTVFDADFADRDYHDRNGFVFEHYSPDGLESALSRAFGMWWGAPEYWRELMVNGMRRDFSWNQPAEHYLNIYNHIKEP